MLSSFQSSSGGLDDSVEREVPNVSYDLPKRLFNRPVSRLPSLAATVESGHSRDESDTLSTCSMISALTSHSIFNQSKGFRVIARVRPLSTADINNNAKIAITALPDTSQIEVGSKRFSFDAVYGPDSTQSQVYNTAVSDLVPDLLRGMNATVLAYGHTGSGKTHTIFGGFSTNQEKAIPMDGIAHRAVFDLFDLIGRSDSILENAEVSLSCMEIYNEEIKDLIEPETKSSDLMIRMDKRGGVTVKNLARRRVASHYEVYDLLKTARDRRVTASTSYNQTSSRSHAICTLFITGTPTGKENYGTLIKSKLTLVDLAGSERVHKANMAEARMKEGININKSLLVLGQVLSTLSEIGRSQNNDNASTTSTQTHVKYRDSKLTRILQEVLEGNSKTVMVACVSSSTTSSMESTNTLRYAENARNIKIKPVKNVFLKPMSQSEIEALLKENHLLKMKIELMEAESKSTTSDIDDHSTTSDVHKSNHTPQSTKNELNSSRMSPSKDIDEIAKLKAQCLYLQERIEETNKTIPIDEDILEASHRADKWQMYCEELMAIMKKRGIDFPDSLTGQGRFQSLFLVNDLRKEVLNLRHLLEGKAPSFEEDENSTIGHDDLPILSIDTESPKKDLDFTSAADTPSPKNSMALPSHDTPSPKNEITLPPSYDTPSPKNEITLAPSYDTPSPKNEITLAPSYDTSSPKNEITLASSYDTPSPNGDIALSHNPSFDTAEEEDETISSELVELNESIEQKETNLQLMQRERKTMLEMRSYFETAIHTLQEEIESLIVDRNALQEKVKNASKENDNDANIDKMRERIVSMQDRIKELRKKTKEHEKCLILQRSAESKCNSLEVEVKEDRRKMKELRRKLKVESRERRHENKAAIVSAVKMEGEKNRIECELNKVKEVSAKKEAILRRKANDAVKKQKALAELNKKLFNETIAPS